MPRPASLASLATPRSSPTHAARSRDSLTLLSSPPTLVDQKKTKRNDSPGVPSRRKRVVLHHMNFKGKVAACEFSPCGRSFAVCVGKAIQIWATPTMLKEFAPFRLLRAYGDVRRRDVRGVERGQPLGRRRE